VKQTGENDTNIRKLENSIFFKVDTLEGKQVINDRCGAGAPNFRILKDSVYYFYPLEGEYYKITNIETNENFVIYHTKFSDPSSTKKRDFKIQVFSNYVKLYINNDYEGTFVDSNKVGKDVKYYRDGNCGNEENEPINIVGKWRLNCDNESTVFIKKIVPLLLLQITRLE